MVDRKKDHIEMAFDSQISQKHVGLYYEPMLSAHPDEDTDISINFLNKTLKAPLWISSMTGGTEKAKLINKNLATIANKFGIGMGLGSCRSLLTGNQRIEDFDYKSVVGNFPFYANLGIAQLENLVTNRQLYKVKELLTDLNVDGLIIHVNPLQEWAQPEGDQFRVAPIETIKQTLFELETNIIVKEVGQGFGPNSLISLMNLPLAAIDFAGHGGTNFTALELARHSALASGKRVSFQSLAYVGHTAAEMIQWVNTNISGQKVQCKSFIISGGISDAIEGHKLREQLNASSIIGMGSAFLKYAESLIELENFTQAQVDILKLSKCFFKGS